MFSIATRRASTRSLLYQTRLFSTRPVRRSVTLEERTAQRVARKERASRVLQQQKQAEGTQAAGTLAAPSSLTMSRYMWYVIIGMPIGLLGWAYSSPDNPPSRFAKWIGLTDWISSYTDVFAKPSFDKLLPDWSQVRLVVNLD